MDELMESISGALGVEASFSDQDLKLYEAKEEQNITFSSKLSTKTISPAHNQQNDEDTLSFSTSFERLNQNYEPTGVEDSMEIDRLFNTDPPSSLFDVSGLERNSVHLSGLEDACGAQTKSIEFESMITPSDHHISFLSQATIKKSPKPETRLISLLRTAPGTPHTLKVNTPAKADIDPFVDQSNFTVRQPTKTFVIKSPFKPDFKPFLSQLNTNKGTPVKLKTPLSQTLLSPTNTVTTYQDYIKDQSANLFEASGNIEHKDPLFDQSFLNQNCFSSSPEQRNSIILDQSAIKQSSNLILGPKESVELQPVALLLENDDLDERTIKDINDGDGYSWLEKDNPLATYQKLHAKDDCYGSDIDFNEDRNVSCVIDDDINGNGGSRMTDDFLQLKKDLDQHQLLAEHENSEYQFLNEDFLDGIISESGFPDDEIAIESGFMEERNDEFSSTIPSTIEQQTPQHTRTLQSISNDLFSPGSFFASRSGQLGDLESREQYQRPMWVTPKHDSHGRLIDPIVKTPGKAATEIAQTPTGHRLVRRPLYIPTPSAFKRTVLLDSALSTNTVLESTEPSMTHATQPLNLESSQPYNDLDPFDWEAALADTIPDTTLEESILIDNATCNFIPLSHEEPKPEFITITTKTPSRPHVVALPMSTRGKRLNHPSITRHELDFGELSKGEEKTLFMRVCNADEKTAEVTFIATGDFIIPLRDLSMTPRSFLVLPVCFSPKSRGDFEERLIIRKSRSVLRVTLKGIAR